MELEELEAQKARAQRLWTPAPFENAIKFYVDAPMQRTVVDAKDGDSNAGDIITKGYGSTWVQDRDEEYVHPNAFDDTLTPFLEKNPMMLWQHNMDWPLGNFKKAWTDDWGLYMEGVIPKVEDREPDWKHLAYHSVAKGIVRTKSIGGFFQRMVDEAERWWIMKVALMETSIVSIPSNPESIFEAAVKTIKGGTRPTLTPRHIEQMLQILGANEMTDPELLTMNEKGLRGRYDELSAFYRKCGKNPPEYEEWHELVKDTASAKGLEALRPQATKVIAFMQKAHGHTVEVRRGRTLSKKNEEKLVSAQALIDEVVSSVRNGDDGSDDGD